MIVRGFPSHQVKLMSLVASARERGGDGAEGEGAAEGAGGAGGGAAATATGVAPVVGMLAKTVAGLQVAAGAHACPRAPR